MWPAEQLFLTDQELDDLYTRVHQAFSECVRSHRIDADLSSYLNSLYLPLSAWLMQKKQGTPGPLIVGICGGQGSGKSTSTDFIATVLEHGFNCRVASLSIDDIYKTRADRQAMAEQVHPLFATRGVPMTHDVELGLQVLESLSNASGDTKTPLPSFDKSLDDRADIAQWPVFAGRPDIIILEGWCVGAVAQSPKALSAPINLLERDEDADGLWRSKVNAALEAEYQTLFGKLDVLMLLKVESMKKVFKWRRLQERKLEQKVAEDPAGTSGLRVMSKKEVDRFIMHYERLTRHILQEMPARADIILPIDDSHNPASVIINKPAART